MGSTTIMGKPANIIGDSNSLLVLRGSSVKVLWGGKFIDVIKNGASTGSDILKIVSSLDDISSNGIYIIPTELGNEVWISIDGTKVNIGGEIGTTYVSFLAEQKEVTSDLKYTALTNAGFYYETLLEAQQAGIKAGIIFIVGENKLYLANNGKLTEYATTDSNVSFDELVVKDLTIYDEGPYMAISSPSLLFRIDEKQAILLDLLFKSYLDLVMLEGTYIQSYNASPTKGYRLYVTNSKSTLEIDNVIVRESLKVPTKYVEVTVEEFRKLIRDKKLIKNLLYRLYNFRNFWELGEDEILESKATDEKPTNVRPLIVTAKDSENYYINDCFFEEDKECIVSYDVNYNKLYTVPGGVVEALGLITKMKDPNGNICNYNFRHLKFYKDEVWIPTFLGEGFYNNNLTLENIRVLAEVKTEAGTVMVTFEDLPNYATFISPCSDNTFKSQDAPLEIHEVFNNNIVYKNWDNVTYTSIVDCIFKDNIIDTTLINAEGCIFENKVLNNEILAKVTDSRFEEILLDNNINGEIIDSTFKKLVNTNKVTDRAKIIDSTFEGIIQGSNIDAYVDGCIFEEVVEESNINKAISDCTFLKKVSNSNINAELIGCLFKREVTNVDIGCKLDGCTFEYEVDTTNLFSNSNLIFRNCLFLQRVVGTIEAPDKTITELLQSDEPKLIIFVEEKGVKKLKVTLTSILTIPSGAIIMWHGAVIPYGWVVCDGNNNTPNLIGRFIKATSEPELVGELVSELDEDNELTLTREHLPEHSHPHAAHTHTVSGGSGNTTGSTGPLALTATRPLIKEMSTVDKSVITSVTGEGVTSESAEIKTINSMSSDYPVVTGGTHDHSITSLDISISSTTSEEEYITWTNKPIKIEPRAYALIFIMKL